MGNWRMNNRMNFFKRLTALLLAMLLFTTMMGDDFFSLADEEIAVESVESEPAQAAPESGGASEAVATEAAPVETAPAETASADAAVPTETPAAETPATTVEGNVPAEGAVSDVPATEGAATTTDGQTTVDTPADTPADTPTTEPGEGSTGENTNPTETETQSPEDSVSENNANDPANPEVIDSETEKATTEEVTEEKTTEEKTEEELTEEELLEKEKLEKEQLEKELLEKELEEKKKTEEELGGIEDLEEEKDKDEDCDHEWGYQSNGDGSHTVTCELCGETYDEECTYDAYGKCIYCDDEKEEEGYLLVLTRINKVVDGVNITVKGMLPEGASVEISSVSTEVAENILQDAGEGEYNIFKAFDITIYDSEGNVYQPQTDGETVEIKVTGVSELNDVADENVEVLRVEHDNQSVTNLNADVNGTEVQFESEHFSYILIGEKLSDAEEVTGISIEPDETVAFTGTYTGTNYGRINTASIQVYLYEGDEFSCDVTVRKNLTNLTTPLSGNEVATDHTQTYTATETGWHTVSATIDVDERAWMAYNASYAVIFSNFNDTILLKEGSSTLYVNGAENSDGAYFYYTTETNSDPYTITQIDVSSSSGKTIINNTVYYEVNEEDTLVGTAKDSSGNSYDVDITWALSSSDDGTQVTISSEGALVANSPGKAIVTASYGSVTAEVTIYVYKILLNGSESFSATYTGNEINPTITLKDADSTISEGSATFSVAYSDNTDVGTATATIIEVNNKYSFTKTYTITNRSITEFTFPTESDNYTISDGTVEGVTGITGPDGVSIPELGTGFTITLAKQGTTSAGISYDATITGIGNYTGTTTVEGIIYSSDLVLENYIEIDWRSTPDKTYTGSAIEFSLSNFVITEKSSGNTIESDDFNLAMTYSDNTDAGTGIVSFYDSTGTYSGTIELTFTIEAADLQEGDFSYTWEDSQNTFTYTGSEIEPGDKLTLTYLGSEMSETKTLAADTDYELSYSNNKNVGNSTAVITVTGKGNYTGTQTITFSIEGDLSTQAIIYLDGNRAYSGNSYVSGMSETYTGLEIKPSIVKVYLPGRGYLTQTTEFTYDIVDADGEDDCINAGTKTVVITGVGTLLAGKTIDATYEITSRSITSGKISFALTEEVKTKGKTYTGSAVSLESGDYTFTFNNGTSTVSLVQDTDYTISCANNTDVTTSATYTITGIGNFKDTKSGTYTISAADISTATVKFEDADSSGNLSVPYTGKAKEPTVKVTLNSMDMTGNFDVTYNNNISVGTATATVTPKNNLAGDAVPLSFTITSKSLKDTTITIKNNSIGDLVSSETDDSGNTTYYYFCSGYAPTYTGGSVAPKSSDIVVKDGNSTLTQGADNDYTISTANRWAVSDYETHKAAGTLSSAAQVTIKGQNNYAGSTIVVYYNIVQRTLDSTTATITGADGTSNIVASFTSSTEANKPSASEIIVKYNGTTLTYGTDFYIDFENSTDETAAKTSGEGKNAIVVGNGNYTGSVAFTYTIGKSIENATITLSNPFTGDTFESSDGVFQSEYVGENIPDLAIEVDGEALETSDYTVTSTTSNQEDIYNSYNGQNIVTVTLTGSEGYYGSIDYLYKINPINLNIITDSDITSGKGITTLGTTQSFEYTSEDKDISDAYVLTYKIIGGDGYAEELVKNTDYSLSTETIPGTYTPDTSDTSYSVTITAITTGKGNFTGSNTYGFKVTSGSVNSLTIDYEASTSPKVYLDGSTYWVYYNSGANIEFDNILIVKNTANKTLTQGTDYEVYYYTGDEIADSEATTDALTASGCAGASNVGTSYVYIHGIGKYAGFVHQAFEIRAIDIEDDSDFVVEISKDYYYQAAVIKPEYTVKYGDTTLVKDVDYTVEYGTNTYPYKKTDSDSTNYVKVTGIGKYSGTKTEYFNIFLDLSDETHVTIEPKSYSYSLEDTPEVTISYTDGTTQYAYNQTTDGDTNYTVSRASSGTGSDSIIVTGLHDATANTGYGSRTIDGIHFYAKLSDSNVSLTQTDFAYTGTEIDISDYISLTYGGEKDTDYTITYNSNRTTIGEKTATLTATDTSSIYKESSSVTLTYYIKYDLSDENTNVVVYVNNVATTSADYNSSGITYMLDVFCGEEGYETSIYGKSYGGTETYVTYRDTGMTSPGTHYIYVNSNSEWVMNGPAKATFTINTVDISGYTALMQKSDGTYASSGIEYPYANGNAIQPEVKVTSESGEELVKGTDYTVTYNNQYNVGTAYATITGIGGYAYEDSEDTSKGRITISYSITQVDLADATITMDTAYYAGYNLPVKPAATVKYGTKTLTEGTDYEISYSNNKGGLNSTGTATITALSDNFTGSVSEDFAVNKLNLEKNANLDISPDSAEYTGNIIPVTVSVEYTNPYYSRYTDEEKAAAGSTSTVTLMSTYDYQFTMTDMYGSSVDSENITEMGIYNILITGVNNCEQTAKDIFTVTTRSIKYNWETTGEIEITVSDVDTLGEKPEITIVDNGVAGAPKTLIENTDFVVKQINNTKAGEGSVVISGATNSNYTVENITVPFNLGKSLATLAENNKLTLTVSDESYTYNGVSQIPDLTIVADGETLTSSDYTAVVINSGDTTETEDSINAADKTIIITGKGNYYDTASFEDAYVINPRVLTGRITYKNSFEYTEGSTEDITFTLSDDNMEKLDGTASNKLYGTSTYADWYYEEYNNAAIKPEITITDSGLAEGASTTELTTDDYTIEYVNNNAYYDPTSGTIETAPHVKVTIGAAGSNYYGSALVLTGYFIIGSSSLEDNSFTISFTNGNTKDYTGSAVEPGDIVVKNSSAGTLTKDKDYTVYYSDTELTDTSTSSLKAASSPVDPGKAYVYVEGKGSYKGVISEYYNVVADLADTNIVTFADDGTMTEGIADQLRTGSAIVPDFSVILYRADGTYINLSKDVDYAVSVSSIDGYTEKGTATIEPYSAYYKNSNSADFNILFDPTLITVTADAEEYTFTGFEIEPEFSTNNDAIVVDTSTITYVREGETESTDDLINAGKITATIYCMYKTSSEIIDYPFEVEFTIVPRDISEATMIMASNQRYNGKALKPSFTAYIKTESKVGESQMYKLTSSDYSVDYGNYVSGTGKVILTGTGNFDGTKSKTYTISLGTVVNLSATASTSTSITASWIGDMYGDGTELTLQKLNSSGSYSTLTVIKVTGNTYTFSGLDSSSSYQVLARSYTDSGVFSNKYTSVIRSTEVSSSTVHVSSSSSGRATVYWDETGDATVFYIYRDTNTLSRTDDTLVAVIPATTYSYTNTGLSAGTYYYYIDGYNISNSTKTHVSQSDYVSVTVN